MRVFYKSFGHSPRSYLWNMDVEVIFKIKINNRQFLFNEIEFSFVASTFNHLIGECFNNRGNIPRWWGDFLRNPRSFLIPHGRDFLRSQIFACSAYFSYIFAYIAIILHSIVKYLNAPLFSYKKNILIKLGWKLR